MTPARRVLPCLVLVAVTAGTEAQRNVIGGYDV